MRCSYHICSNKLKGRQTRFCSKNCKSNFYVALNRRKMKQKALKYKGGKCEICGYNKSMRALGFHHNNGNKDFGIAQAGCTRSWEKIKKELNKCILVCANCHAEIHDKENINGM
jgi:hypothetical protein